MVLCIIAFFVFAVLGIFSAKYRAYARESFSCVFRMVTLRPCDTGFDQKLKMNIISNMFNHSPRVANYTYRHFKALSWVFAVLMLVSLVYSAYGLYNLAVHGTCDPANPQNCVFTPAAPECAKTSCGPNCTCGVDCNCTDGECLK